MKTLLAAAAMAALATSAYAQQCGPREMIKLGLAEKYGEFVQVVGVTKRGNMMEIYANSETGTYTVMITKPDGVSCQAADGQGFEIVEPEAPAEGA